MRFFRKRSPAVSEAHLPSFSAPPASNPVEVGLALRSARERKGISLEQAREATGVPKVDLEALERGRLEVLHVEQAAIVGLWRYAELLGLDPGTLVGVIRSHWPRSALAVDALYSTPDGAGMPNARLALGEGILSRIVPMGRELTTGSSALGLSDATRRQLAEGGAHDMLAIAVLGPVRGSRQSRTRSTESAETPSSPDDAGPTAGPTAGTSLERPAGTPVAEPEATTAARLAPEPEATTGVVEPGQRSRRWSSQLAHVVAERFGLDDDGDEGPADPDDAASPIGGAAAPTDGVLRL